jgi:hypothetical protein
MLPLFNQRTQKAEDKYVISFLRAKSRLACSKAVARSVAEVLGSDPNDWRGKSLTLYQGDFNGRPCIRAMANVERAEPANDGGPPQSGRDYEEVFDEP